MAFCTRDNKQTLRDKRLAVKQWMFGTSCRAALLASFCLLVVMYIIQTSSVSTKGFVISDLQSQINELENETRALDVEISTHRSMSSVEARLETMGMVPADNIVYANPVGTAVARR